MRRARPLFLDLLIGAILLGVCAAGARPASAQRLDSLSPEARLSLVTVLPGEAAYELFGHSAIRVYDPLRGVDALFNYGTFQFDAYFLPKFIYGQLDYLLRVIAYQRELPYYRQRGRSVIEQELRLSPAQRQALAQFLEINAQPENRTYRYLFLTDNCSTRTRDALERTLGDVIRFPDTYRNPGTYRELLDRYVDHLPFMDLGFYLVLGPPADAMASARDAHFLPDYLKEAFDGAEIRGEAGWEPLVVRTDTVYWNAGAAERAEGGFPVWPITWGLLALGVALTWWRRNEVGGIIPYFDRMVFGVVDLAGVLMAFLWLIALHDVTDRNWNLFWAWPTHLLAIVWIKARPAWLRGYWMATAAAGMIGLAGWGSWPQALHPALVPIVLLLVLRSGWLAWKMGVIRGLRA